MERELGCPTPNQRHNILEEGLIDPEQYTEVKIHDINDKGTLAVELTKTDGSKVAALLHTVELKVDYDRDGEDDILNDLGDNIPEDESFVFWVNDDNDTGDDLTASDEQNGDDSADNVIDSLRDLEDFTRLHINLSALKNQLEDGSLEVGLKFTKVIGDPSIRLFYAADQENGSNKYLTEQIEANKQKSEDVLFKLTGEETQWFPSEIIDRMNSKGHLHLLFEGVNEGFGDMSLVIKTGNGSETAISFANWRITHISDMYEHWTVGDHSDSSGGRDDMARTIGEMPAIPQKDITSGVYQVNSPETDDVIVFVHGWRIQTWERRKGFADVSYKRLWQSGFKGRFYHFSWPTDHCDRRDFWPYDPLDPDSYVDSEQVAYNAGALGLKNFLINLNNQYPGKVRMFAHSMGGIVASEALLNGAPIHTYAACQTAMAAHAYDASATVRPTGVGVIWETPEVYTNYPQTGNPYYQSIVPKMYNFYNERDDALAGWEVGQLFKPNDITIPIEFYYYNQSKNEFSYIPPLLSFDSREVLDFPSDRYEIFAHAAEARSLAIGTQFLPGAKGNFDLRFDFNTPSSALGDHSKDHSGQFNGTMMLRHEFWEVLLEDAFEIEQE